MQDAKYNPPLSPLSKGGIKGGYHESCIRFQLVFGYLIMGGLKK